MQKDIKKFYVGKYNKEDKSYDFDRTALLVIDIQEKLMPEINQNQKVINNSQALLKVFNLYGIKTIATEQYPKGLGRSVEDILDLLDEDKIFAKTIFNAYIDEVKSYLEENKIKNVIITGVEAHICVYQTVRSLLKDDYKVFIVTDAISAYDQEKSKEAIKSMKDMGAVGLVTEMLIYDIVGDSKSEHFKEVAGIVKDLRIANKKETEF